MDWQAGLDKLKQMQRTDLAACLLQGDLIEMIMAVRGGEMRALKKKEPGIWRDMGGANWRSVAMNDIAMHMRCSARTVMLRRQTALVFGPDILPRDPDADLPDVAWTVLARLTKFGDKAEDALKWVLDNDASSWDVNDMKLTADGFVIERKHKVIPVRKDGKLFVTCPCGCGVTFEVATSEVTEQDV